MVFALKQKKRETKRENTLFYLRHSVERFRNGDNEKKKEKEKGNKNDGQDRFRVPE